MTPNVPDADAESRLTVAPKALKDMIEHFTLNKGAKSDPQLIWRFAYEEIILKTMESSLDGKGKDVSMTFKSSLTFLFSRPCRPIN